MADLGEDVGGATVKTIGLPCSGKVDVPYLLKALETGADGVVIVACKKKECRHLEGSLRAHKRAEAVESLLEEIGSARDGWPSLSARKTVPDWSVAKSRSSSNRSEVCRQNAPPVMRRTNRNARLHES